MTTYHGHAFRGSDPGSRITPVLRRHRVPEDEVSSASNARLEGSATFNVFQNFTTHRSTGKQ